MSITSDSLAALRLPFSSIKPTEGNNEEVMMSQITTRTSGTATLVDAEEHIEKSGVRSPTSVPKSRKTELQDIAKIVGKSTSLFSEVTNEQIDRVRKVHDGFAENAKFSFNYNVLLLVAAVIAGLGLVSNSATIIIASMLVSPIMGPVVGMAYGTTICDRKLVKMSLRTESISLIFCILSGMAVAAICGMTRLADDWPTSEMTSRGTWENFLVGLPVAFFSGLGVAVSLLDNQTSSLVGVAISASLLPPAVNAGVIWTAYLYYNHGVLLEDVEIDQALLKEFRNMGTISLLLTLANIALIWIASMLMFRMKEVLPIEKKVFWNDLGVARKIYQKRAFVAEPMDTSDSDLESVVVVNDEELKEVEVKSSQHEVNEVEVTLSCG